MSNYRNTDIQQLADWLKALANPHRLRIFLRLVSCCGPSATCRVEPNLRACVGELGADLELAPSTVSHHVKELKQAGLIRMERSGQRVECWIPAAVLESLSNFFTRCCAGEVDPALQLPSRDRARS